MPWGKPFAFVNSQGQLVYFPSNLTDGTIRTYAQDNDSLYIGGDFQRVFPEINGNILSLDKYSGISAKLSSITDGFNGPTNCAVLDGTSLYVGGAFSAYKDTPVSCIAKIDITTGDIDTNFIPPTITSEYYNYGILCIEVSGNSLYIGGDFVLCGSTARKYLAKLSKIDGSLDLTFNTSSGFFYFNDVTAPIYSIVADGTDLYVGGLFNQYKGVDAASLVKISTIDASRDMSFDTTTGVYTYDFGQNTQIGQIGTIKVIRLDGSNLYIAGHFSTYKGIGRRGLASISSTDASLDTSIKCPVGIAGTKEVINDMVISGNNIYIAGSFNRTCIFNGKFARIDSTNATNQKLAGILDGFNDSVLCMALDGTDLYVGGRFTTFNGIPRAGLAKIDITTGNLDATFDTSTGISGAVYLDTQISGAGLAWYAPCYTPGNSDLAVNALVIESGSIYIGGRFKAYKGNTVCGLAKLSTTDATIDPIFDTSTGISGGINAIALDGNSLYIGGQYTQYKGVISLGLSKISKINASIDTTFDTRDGIFNTNSIISDGGSYYPRNFMYPAIKSLVVDGNYLFVGGRFNYYKNAYKSSIIKISKITASLDPLWTTYGADSVANSYNGLYPEGPDVNTIHVDNTNIYIGGFFTSFSGTSKPNLIKASKINGAIDPTFIVSTNQYGQINSIVGDSNYIYIGFSDLRTQYPVYSGSTSNYVAKISKATGVVDSTFDTSNLGTDGPVKCLLLGGSYLYAGGEFNYYNEAVKSERIALINKDTLTVNAMFDTASGPDATVSSILLDGASIYIGGSFNSYKGLYDSPRIVKISSNDATRDLGFSTSALLIASGTTPIYDLISYSNKLHALGSFFSTGGTLKSRIAKIKKQDFSIDSSFIVTSGANQSIYTLLVESGSLYIGGSFTLFNDTPVPYFTKVSTTNASVDLNFTITGCNASVTSLASDETGLYLGGSFTSYTGVARQRVAKIDKLTAALDPTFNTSTGANGTVNALLTDSGSLYIGGQFGTYKGVNIQGLARISKVDASLQNSTPFYLDTSTTPNVTSLVDDGTSIYAGGNFLGIDSTQSYYADVDKTSGAIIPTPIANFNGRINKMIKDGNYLYIAGAFTTYSGTTRQYMAKVSLVDGTLDSSFNTTTGFNAEVKDFRIDDTHIYAVGSFTTYKGTTRQYIAKISKTDASLDATFDTSRGLDYPSYCIAIDGNRLHVGSYVGSSQKYKGIYCYSPITILKTTAAVDLSVNNPLGSASFGDGDYTGQILDDGDAFYVNSSRTHLVTSNHGNITRLDPTTLNATRYPNIGSGTVGGYYTNGLVFYAEQDGDYLYICGSFTTYSGVYRPGLAKIHATTGALDPTFGNVTSGVWMLNGGSYPMVRCLTIDGNDCYIAGEFVSISGATRKGYAKLNKNTTALDTTWMSNITSYLSGSQKYYIKALSGSILCDLATGVNGDPGPIRNGLGKVDKIYGLPIPTDRCIPNISPGLGRTVIDDTYIYIGGTFSGVSLATRGLSILNDVNGYGYTLSGLTTACSGGVIYAIAVDGNDVYIGGTFTSYNTVSRNRIAKVNALDGSLDLTFNPGTGFNAQVNTILVSGSALFVGGQFGTYSGSGSQCIVKLDKTTGAKDSIFNVTSAANDYIYSMYLDGSDLYIGGNFTSYKGISRNRFAKISVNDASLADLGMIGEVGFGNSVRSLIGDSSNLYMGGYFTNYTNAEPYFTRINTSLGTNNHLSGMTSGFNGPIFCQVQDGTDLYVGGGFTAYSGTPRLRVAKISLIDGTLDTTFNTVSGCNTGQVNSLLLDGNSLYIGGTFTQYSGVAVQYLAKISKVDATRDATFNVSTGANAFITTLEQDSNYIYPAGNFTTYKSIAQQYVTRVAKSDGSLSGTTMGVGSAVSGIYRDGTGLYVAGNFTNTYAMNNRFARLSTISGNDQKLTNYLNGFDGQVNCIVIDGTDAYIGGAFTTYNGISRNQIAKISLTDGTLDSTFNPGAGFGGAGSPVLSIVLDGSDLYVGGNFTTYSGTTRQRIAKISKIDAALDATFAPSSGAGAVVNSVCQDASYIYLGGNFTTYSGTTRNRVAKISKVDASLDSTFNPSTGPGAAVNSMILNSGYLYIGGSFTTYSGTTRQYVAKISTSTAALDTTFDSSTGANAAVNMLASDGTYLYLAGAFTTYKSTARQYVAKILMTTAALDATFDSASGASATTNSICYDGSSSIYLGGTFTTYKGTTRNRLVKISASTAALDTTFDMATVGSNNTIYALAVSGSYLYAGGSFTYLSGVFRQRLVKYNTTNFTLDSTFDTTSGPSSTVVGMVTDTTSLYITGDFTTYKGTARTRVAKISKTDASLDATFDTATGANTLVNTIKNDGTYLYIGGGFTTYKGTARQNFARISNITAALDSTFAVYGANNSVMSIVLDGSAAYLGGGFTLYGGGASQYLLKVNRSTLRSDPSFNTASGADNAIFALALDGNSLYLGGDFITYSGVSNAHTKRLVKVSAIDASRDTNFTISGSGNFGYPVRGLAVSGNYVYGGGDSLWINSIGAFWRLNKVTGAADFTFTPYLDFYLGGIALANNKIYVGGDQRSHKSNDFQKLIRVRIADLSLDESFNTTTLYVTRSGPYTGSVLSLALDGNNMYIGGEFGTFEYGAQKIACRGLVKVDKNTLINDPAFNTNTPINYSYNIAKLLVTGNSLLVLLYASGYYYGKVSKVTGEFEILPRKLLYGIDYNPYMQGQPFIDSNGYIVIYGSIYSLLDRRSGGITRYLKSDYSVDTNFNTDSGTMTQQYYPGMLSNSSSDIVTDSQYLYISQPSQMELYRGVPTNKGGALKIDKYTGYPDVNFFPYAYSSTISSFVDGNSLYLTYSYSTSISSRVKVYGYPLYHTTVRPNQRYVKGILKMSTIDGTVDDTTFDVHTTPTNATYLLLDGNTIHCGGSFTKVMSKDARKIFKINKSTWTVDNDFNTAKVLRYADTINTLAVDGSDLYAAGSFTTYSGMPYSSIVKVSTTDGSIASAFDSSGGTTSGISTGIIYTLVPGVSNMYALGNFTRYKDSGKLNAVNIDKQTGLKK